MDNAGISYRIVRDLASLEAVADLEIAIWQLNERDAAPSHLLHALVENGSVLIVAETEQQMVGLSLGFAGWRASSRYLWSHMTGIHPHYQGRGIGYNLKQRQRQWAVDNGYTTIRWTFDPLQRGNANFNIHKLGATANIYHIHYYGEMTDGINAGLPSDRLEVTWVLDKPPVRLQSVSDIPFLIQADAAGLPEVHALESHETGVLIEIPASINHLKQTDLQAALAWRLALRETMQQAFAQGMTIVDFTHVNNRWVYVLAVPRPWYMYVVECKDHTLYTGVALDVERRITQHNAGRGAAYTAARRPVRLLAAWRYPDQGHALRAELAFKKKGREQKLMYIASRSSFAEGVFITL